MRVWMLLIAGCAAGKNEQAEPVKPDVIGVAFRWHDAAGEQVTDGPDLLVWVDGLLWRVDPETGKLGGSRIYGEQIYERNESGVYPFESYGLFYSVRCDEGPAYIKAPPPRLVVDGYLWGEEGVLYTRPDDVVAAFDADGSGYHTSITGCGSATIPLAPLVRLDEMTALGIPPSSGWVPPLHPEPIE